MTRSEAKAAAEVLLAFASGIPIQNRQRGTEQWHDVAGAPLSTFAKFEYRVKPQPEEFYITVYGDDARAALANGARGDDQENSIGDDYDTAKAARQNGIGGHRVFKVTEVLE